VLFVAGDNDTYPLWYAQQARGVRRDVTPVTMPLLPAPWYRAELARRDSILSEPEVERWTGTAAAVRAIATHALARGRPVAISVAAEPKEREAAGACWRLRGMVYVLDRPPAREGSGSSSCAGVDSAVTATIATGLEPVVAASPRAGTDGTGEYVHDLLSCPALALRAGADSAARGLLASRCNSR
jgi:hypothetical protein